METRETEPKPWEGDPRQLYPSDEERGMLRKTIDETLVRHVGDGGITGYQLADVVAEHYYDEETEEARFTTGDVILEVSRMMGTKVKRGNSGLYPKT